MDGMSSYRNTSLGIDVIEQVSDTYLSMIKYYSYQDRIQFAIFVEVSIKLNQLA